MIMQNYFQIRAQMAYNQILREALVKNEELKTCKTPEELESLKLRWEIRDAARTIANAAPTIIRVF